MRIKILLTLLALALAFSACEKSSTPPGGVPAAVKENAKPVADGEVAVIDMENQAAYGSITIELYSNIAPKMVARFKELSKEGVYNGVIFHRVNDSVIQSGDPLSKDADPTNDGTGDSGKPDVGAEFSDIPYDIGIVGAARGPDFNSANSQFFITLKREPGFDRRYTVFGKVIDGMINVKTIAGAPRNGERPMDEIRIKQIRIVPRESAGK
jgi:peptidylprolyl isomerase